MTSEAQDESQVRQLIFDQARAICAKDIDGLMALYTADLNIFGVTPPFQTRDAKSWRRTWEERLPLFPNKFEVEIRDLVIDATDDLAFAHWIFRFKGVELNHPALKTYIRITMGCRKLYGRWRIEHEHYSVPFDPHTSQAAFALEA